MSAKQPTPQGISVTGAVAAERPESHMDEGSHALGYEDNGCCEWRCALSLIPLAAIGEAAISELEKPR